MVGSKDAATPDSAPTARDGALLAPGSGLPQVGPVETAQRAPGDVRDFQLRRAPRVIRRDPIVSRPQGGEERFGDSVVGHDEHVDVAVSVEAAARQRSIYKYAPTKPRPRIVRALPTRSSSSALTSRYGVGVDIGSLRPAAGASVAWLISLLLSRVDKGRIDDEHPGVRAAVSRVWVCGVLWVHA